MKILIEMPLEHYNPFVAKCGSGTQEYSTLINGMVVRDADTGEKQLIEILCEKDEAKRLLDVASRLYPKAMPAIEAGMDIAHEL